MEALKGAGPLRDEQVILPGSGEALRIHRPADFDGLLDAAASDPEQNLPYWAELWPSGIALAARVLREPEAFLDMRVLELGCGLGVTAIAALRAGADLLVTDYAPEALALCALNCRAQAGRVPEQLRLNWRQPSSDLLAAAGEGFPVVLAADVLYEERDVAPLLALVERLVAPEGVLVLAEPGRRPARVFLDDMADRGWRRDSETCPGPWPDPEDNHKGVVVGLHRLARNPAVGTA